MLKITSLLFKKRGIESPTTHWRASRLPRDVFLEKCGSYSLFCQELYRRFGFRLPLFEAEPVKLDVVNVLYGNYIVKCSTSTCEVMDIFRSVTGVCLNLQFEYAVNGQVFVNITCKVNNLLEVVIDDV